MYEPAGLWWGAPSVGQSRLFGGQMLNFLGRKMKKVPAFIKRKKRNSFHPARWSARNPKFFVRFFVSRAKQFFWTLSKYFWGQKLKKLARMPMLLVGCWEGHPVYESISFSKPKGEFYGRLDSMCGEHNSRFGNRKQVMVVLLLVYKQEQMAKSCCPLSWQGPEDLSKCK